VSSAATAVVSRPWRRSPWDREIARLAVPAFGALVAEPLYLLADTAVVGHLGTEQLAGLAVAGQVLTTGYALFIFLAYGTTAAVARLFGAGDRQAAAHQAVQSGWLALIISIPLVAGGLGGAGWLVRAVGATGAAAGYAETYLRISVLGVPALLFTLAATGYLRGRQDTRTPLLVAVASAVGNLLLELLLIYGLGYGIGASAAATVAAQYAAAAVYVIGIGRAARGHRVGLRPDRRAVSRLARVGLDLVVRTAALQLSFLLATTVAARLGAVAVSAHQIAMQLWMALALALDAIAIAGQAMVGRLLGAGEAAAARAAARRMVELGIGLSALFGLAVLAVHSALPRLFSADPAVLAVGSFLLLWVAAMQPVNGVVFVLDGVLMGAGDMRYLAGGMVGAGLVFAAAAAAVAALGLGIGWLWAALGLLMLTRLVTLLARVRGARWLVLGASR
jgi:MATE family, multidrug efflux pump